jgi:hypothetical protein
MSHWSSFGRHIARCLWTGLFAVAVSPAQDAHVHDACQQQL